MCVCVCVWREVLISGVRVCMCVCGEMFGLSNSWSHCVPMCVCAHGLSCHVTVTW